MKSIFLVVDEDPADRSRLGVALRQFVPGAEVMEAATGLEAIRMLHERGATPSLIFSAFRLGDMNAIELLGRIRQIAWLQQPGAMIVDDDISDRAVIDCYRLGAAGFLKKPVMGFELREALRDFARPAVERRPAIGLKTDLRAA
jgi:CheY-like chemotaxis protein